VLLKKLGFDGQALADESRKLIADFPERQVRFFALARH